MIFELNSIGDFLILLALGTIGMMALSGLAGFIVLLYYEGFLHKCFPFINDPTNEAQNKSKGVKGYRDNENRP